MNLACALAAEGHRVGVLDADVWGFSIPRMLGVHGKPVGFNDMILPLEGHGVKVISMGFFVPEETPVIWRGPMLHKAIEQFLGDVYWGDLDFLLCDLPPGTGDVSISLASFIPGASMLVVTTPQEAARKVAERAGKMAERTNLRPIGVIENMCYYVCPHCGERDDIFGDGRRARGRRHARRPADGAGPAASPRSARAATAASPIVVTDPDAPASVALASVRPRGGARHQVQGGQAAHADDQRSGRRRRRSRRSRRPRSRGSPAPVVTRSGSMPPAGAALGSCDALNTRNSSSSDGATSAAPTTKPTTIGPSEDFGAAASAAVRSGTIRYGHCATPQPAMTDATATAAPPRDALLPPIRRHQAPTDARRGRRDDERPAVLEHAVPEQRRVGADHQEADAGERAGRQAGAQRPAPEPTAPAPGRRAGRPPRSGMTAARYAHIASDRKPATHDNGRSTRPPGPRARHRR